MGDYYIGITYGWKEWPDSYATCYKQVKIVYQTVFVATIPISLGGSTTSDPS
jgi:hypothetical protein